MKTNTQPQLPPSTPRYCHPRNVAIPVVTKLAAAMFVCLQLFLANAKLAWADVPSGMYGQTVQGFAQAVGPISNLQNNTNLTPPTALIGDGPELSTDFNDVFNTPWHLTVDFQDNYQVVFLTGSSNPSANIGGGTIRWNLSDFNFLIADFQPVSLPPENNPPVVSFDQQNIYVGFPVMAAYEPYNSYTFQIVPVPEPGSLVLAALGAFVLLFKITTASEPVVSATI